MSTATDPFGLARFVTAQEGVYEHALAELRRGRKSGHWMWFVFPQVVGLGRSATAQHFAITSRAEAAAYLRHPVLGPRLREAAQVVADVDAGDAEAIFGGIDAIKLRSSMTLFDAIEPQAVFGAVLDRYYDGSRDPATLDRI